MGQNTNGGLGMIEAMQQLSSFKIDFPKEKEAIKEEMNSVSNDLTSIEPDKLCDTLLLNLLLRSSAVSSLRSYQHCGIRVDGKEVTEQTIKQAELAKADAKERCADYIENGEDTKYFEEYEALRDELRCELTELADDKDVCAQASNHEKVFTRL